MLYDLTCLAVVGPLASKIITCVVIAGMITVLVFCLLRIIEKRIDSKKNDTDGQDDDQTED